MSTIDRTVALVDIWRRQLRVGAVDRLPCPVVEIAKMGKTALGVDGGCVSIPEPLDLGRQQTDLALELVLSLDQGRPVRPITTEPAKHCSIVGDQGTISHR